MFAFLVKYLNCEHHICENKQLTEDFSSIINIVRDFRNCFLKGWGFADSSAIILQVKLNRYLLTFNTRSVNLSIIETT